MVTILHKCEGCGKERQVRLLRGEPKHRFCISCTNKRRKLNVDNELHKLGEVRKNKQSIRQMWCACEVCGKPRWVRLEYGRPRSKVCTSCHGKAIGKIFGEDNPNYKHGRNTKENDYVRIHAPLHPRAWHGDGRVLRSRFNLEQALGRPLKRGAHVHHINGNVQDDRPENLMEVFPREHGLLTRLNNHKKKEAGNVGCPASLGRG